MSTAIPDLTLAERAQRVASAFQATSSTGNPVVDAVHALGMTGALQGNVVPSAWYTTIRFRGRPDFAAIMILSDLVNWYSPTFDIHAGQWRAKTEHHWPSAYATDARDFASAMKRLVKRGLVTCEKRVSDKEIELSVNVDVLARFCGIEIKATVPVL